MSNFPLLSARAAVTRHGDEWRASLQNEVTAVAGEFPFGMPFDDDGSPDYSDACLMGTLSFIRHYDVYEDREIHNQLLATIGFTPKMRLDW